jgi:dihydroxy-acid dehydratase
LSKKQKGIYKNLTSYGDKEFSKYMRRAFLSAAGYDKSELDKPIIGIADTSSDYNPCHRDLPEIVNAVKRGVLEAGGLPFSFPTISLNEIFISPTTMLYRNLMAMETEEMISVQPMDAVVLTGGCDKTLPAQLMAAVSADIPAISVVAGPMRTGNWRGEKLGACTDCRRMWGRFRSGELSENEIEEIEQSLCPTGGTCMVMGTASTMACLAETMGMMLPGGATPLSGSGDRIRSAAASGRTAVDIAKSNLVPKMILTREAFENALIVLSAVSGSTNAIVHISAISRRAGVDLTLEDFHDISKRVPLLVDCKPAGTQYMEDFHSAGGMPALLKVLEPLLNLESKGVTGKSLGELLNTHKPPGDWQKAIYNLDRPLGETGALVTLKGSLAPNGAVLKAAASTKSLHNHKGPAVVFESAEDVSNRIDDPSLKITAESVLVLRNSGPVGAGMPEAGYIPIPKRLAEKGVTDMVRVSDTRMSGTAFGTVILHCSPEAAIGGPLALVQNGDIIELNVDERRIDLLVDEKELLSRKKGWSAPALPKRGWKRLYAEHVLPAEDGADLDFLDMDE